MKLSEPGGGEGGAPAGEEDEDETVFLGPRADTRASLRKNRSNAPHLSMEPSKIELVSFVWLVDDTVWSAIFFYYFP